MKRYAWTRRKTQHRNISEISVEKKLFTKLTSTIVIHYVCLRWNSFIMSEIRSSQFKYRMWGAEDSSSFIRCAFSSITSSLLSFIHLNLPTLFFYLFLHLLFCSSLQADFLASSNPSSTSFDVVIMKFLGNWVKCAYTQKHCFSLVVFMQFLFHFIKCISFPLLLIIRCDVTMKSLDDSQICMIFICLRVVSSRPIFSIKLFSSTSKKMIQLVFYL
jgi:uncharacterized membrane protein YhdT